MDINEEADEGKNIGGGKKVRRTALYPPGRFLVLISVRG
jgi:hypothetical protein